MAIRTVITDDEASARAGVRALLARDSNVEVVAECANVADTLRAIVEQKPELSSSTFSSRDRRGLQLLERLPEKQWPVIIFVTAYEAYARDAFDCHAADYLLKPYEDARFFKALERAKQRIEQPAIVATSTAPARFGRRRARALAPGDRSSRARVEVSDATDDQWRRTRVAIVRRRRHRLDRGLRRLRTATCWRENHSSSHYHE